MTKEFIPMDKEVPVYLQVDTYKVEVAKVRVTDLLPNNKPTDSTELITMLNGSCGKLNTGKNGKVIGAPIIEWRLKLYDDDNMHALYYVVDENGHAKCYYIDFTGVVNNDSDEIDFFDKLTVMPTGFVEGRNLFMDVLNENN